MSWEEVDGAEWRWVEVGGAGWRLVHSLIIPIEKCFLSIVNSFVKKKVYLVAFF